MSDCLACLLNNNPNLVPGGRITETKHWIVEHCLGSLGIGSLVIKTKTHKEDLTEGFKEELVELAVLLSKTHGALESVLKPDRIYIAKWGETTEHLHFVIQPVDKKTKQRFDAKGPLLQARMLEQGESLNWKKAGRISLRIRRYLEKHSTN